MLVRFVFVCVTLLLTGVMAKASTHDSVIFYKKQLQNRTISLEKKIRGYYKLYSYLEPTQPQLAQNYLHKGYHLAQKTQSNFGLGWYFKVQGYQALTAGKFDKGIYYSQLAARYFNHAHDTVNQADCSYQRAYGYLVKGELSGAKKILLSALAKLPQNRFYIQQGKIYSLLAHAEDDKNLLRSLDYMLKSRNATLLAKNYSGLYGVYTDLALFYSTIEDYQMALYNAKLSLYWVKKIKPVVYFDLATVASNVAAPLIALKKYRSALYYVNLSQWASKKLNSDSYDEKVLFLKTDIYLGLKRYDLAAQKLAFIQKNNLEPLSLFYYHLLQLKLATSCHLQERVKQHIKSCDSLLNTGAVSSKKLQLNYYDLVQTHYNTIGAIGKKDQFLNKYYQVKIAQLEQQKDYRLIKLQISQYKREKNFALQKAQLQHKKVQSIQKQLQLETYVFVGTVVFLIFILFLIARVVVSHKKRNQQLRVFNILLEELVSEKEVLLQEIHHRVKNNFQIITSILSIQSRQKNVSTQSFLAQFSSRIHSMAFVHEKLYNKTTVGQIDALTFLRELVENDCISFPDKSNKIGHSVTGQTVYLPIEQLLPIGLIIHELTVNSLKYAFLEQEQGEISILLTENDNHLFITYQDNGVGVVEPIIKNTGLTVVDAFVTKLKGTVSVANENGLCYQFQFPKLLDLT